ncbi:MAG: hypothetical protein HYV66_01365, partial [Candidatus Sungbacteria bacterium]|nr:hypothetical protein [Candidatus Sungbacteria bacterium]
MDAQASKMLRRAAAMQEKMMIRRTVTRLDRDQLGEFLVSALAAERNPDLEIRVPQFPLTASQILQNMDVVFTAPDPDWKDRKMQFKVPHQGVVFVGVVNTKNKALEEAGQIIMSGWANGLATAFAVAQAKVRAGQILVDYLHFLEGKNESVFGLGATYVADDLVTEVCLTQAEEQGVALKDASWIRQSAQFGYEELMEDLGGTISVSAFEGELEYTYRLPDPMSVIGAIRNLILATQGEGMLDWAKARFSQMSDREKRLFVYVAEDDVLRELYELAAAEKAATEKAGGN